jgi:hypothetical protein
LTSHEPARISRQRDASAPFAVPYLTSHLACFIFVTSFVDWVPRVFDEGSAPVVGRAAPCRLANDAISKANAAPIPLDSSSLIRQRHPYLTPFWTCFQPENKDRASELLRCVNPCFERRIHLEMPERRYLLELIPFSWATHFSAFDMNFSRPLSIVKRFGVPFRAPTFRIFRNSIPSRPSGSWHAPRIELCTDSARHRRIRSAAISVTARAQKSAVVLL